MSTRIKVSSLDETTAKKIHNDLYLKNESAFIKLYEFTPDRKCLCIPYYYARTLREFGDRSLDDVMMLPDVGGGPVHMKRNYIERDYGVSFELTEIQKPVLKEVMKEIINTGSIILKARTGFGKSIAIMYIGARLKLVTLIYVTRIQFRNQIKSSYEQETDAVIWIPNNKTNPPEDVNVIITTPGLFKNIPSDLLDQVGTLIIDEAPLICTPQSRIPMLTVRPKYVIALSATINRKDGMHKMLTLICGPNMVIKKLDVPIRVIKWNTGIKIPYFEGPKGIDWPKHLEWISSCDERNQMIAEVARKILEMNNPNSEASDISRLFSRFTNPAGHNPTYKLIGMTGNVKDHIRLLPPHLEERNITWDYLDGKKHTYTECNFLMGTPGKIGIGFDQKSGCKNFDGVRINVVMQLASTTQPELAEQEVGRGCRAPVCYVICLVDNNRVSINHWRKGMKAFLDTLDDVEILEYKPSTKSKLSSVKEEGSDLV